MRHWSKGQADERVAEIVRLLHQRLGADGEAAGAFAGHFFARLAPEDVLTRTVETLYAAVLSLWKLAERRPPGAATIRAFNPRIDRDGWTSRHTVVQIVNDDMPFLVDSTMLALQGLGLGVHLLVHPVVPVARDAKGCRQAAGGAATAESLMHIEVDEQTEAEALDRMERVVGEALADVRHAVEDWRAMRAKLDEALAEIEADPPPLDPAEVQEATALLRWMGDNHFTFLGFRDYVHFADGTEQPMSMIAESGLGILRDPERRVMVGLGGFDPKTPAVLAFLQRRELLIVTKANARSLVHRPALLDYIGIRRFDAAGRVVGERRFVGLFTSAAYNRNPRDIPLLRRKVQRTIERAGLSGQSHDGKALLNILETYPRDELFQVHEDELFETAHGILQLHQRPRVGAFVRKDEFGRYASVLVFAPRERYDTQLRKRFGAILEQVYGGTISSFHTQMGGEDPLARIHFIIALPRTDAPEVQPEEIVARLAAAARSWTDDLADALIEANGEEAGNRLLAGYGGAFPAAYRDRFDAQVAVADIGRIERDLAGEGELAVSLYRPLEAGAREFRFKLYRKGAPVPLSDCLPMLENMGFRVLTEEPFAIRQPGQAETWMHDFRLEALAADCDIEAVKEKIEAAFVKVWTGALENDRFNALVLLAGLDWREVTVLRCYCKYLRQAGIAFSQSYIENAFIANAPIARLLVDLFHGLFDPAQAGSSDKTVTRLDGAIEAALEQVSSLDEDRILRRFLNAIAATLRTNYYLPAPAGGPRDYLSVKLDSKAVDDLPLPRPMVEVFVYSPRVEAIHLRGGKVARGGIRWSDRREDFRTEVLGLMKAQMVKNAVIVPVGAKGGFFPKRAPVEGGREAVQADAIECYKTLIRGLLDITDNRKGGSIVPPAHVLRRDGDDPYLVVAADKGTATFSDIANGLAIEYGFWLGDAFASGGSAGYDHKKMGITARGAWELVKRHFREMGRDTQAEPFTVVGVGDMSGDVFGNGMLQSRCIRLIAAFDHRHIFIDPDPDPEHSFAERRRLFELPRSSWADYDPKLISAGGGVFDRKLKSVKLAGEACAALGLAHDTLTPAELIRAILTADVDLLFNGGIGTYVKASTEAHAEAGDRANDAVRVDGRDLRAAVVGEGGNLGFTQRGRIEYALKGGRINTDAIDNSAGVDCSDHEVNIKILVDAVVDEGELTGKQRDRLLAQMTEEVGDLVLRDNYLQGQALSVAEAKGPAALGMLTRFMRVLERRGRLDRTVEFLPDNATIARRQQEGRGLTRPELAVLLAYAKMALYEALLESDLPDDPYFTSDLTRYFPRPLRRRFADAVASHRLRREIVATTVGNSIINRAGIAFIQIVQEEVEATPAEIARAYVGVREIFGLRACWNALEALDNKVPASTQIRALKALSWFLEKATLRLLTRPGGRADIAAAIDAYGLGIAGLRNRLGEVMTGDLAQSLAGQAADLVGKGLPAELARTVASLPSLVEALDVIDAARAANAPAEQAARIHFALGDDLGLHWLRQAAESTEAADTWQRLAANAAVDELDARHRSLTVSVLREMSGLEPDAAVAAWLAKQGAGLERLRQLIAEFKAGQGVDAARLAIANRAVRTLGA